jgi:hypothetical protein
MATGSQGVTNNATSVVAPCSPRSVPWCSSSFFGLDLFGFHANPHLASCSSSCSRRFRLQLLLIRSASCANAAGAVWRLRGCTGLDLNDPRQRRIASIVGVLTLVNVIIVSLAAFRGISMDSTAFCGKRLPHRDAAQYVAARRRMPASGASSAISGQGRRGSSRQVDGLRQVLAVARSSYADADSVAGALAAVSPRHVRDTATGPRSSRATGAVVPHLRGRQDQHRG